MILPLYGFLVLVSLVLIVIGLTKPSESAQALIGFFFLFVLSFVIINGNLEYETGANLTTALNYNAQGDITSTDQSVSYYYEKFNDTTSTRIGKYLAIGAGVGFAGVLFGVAKTKWGKE